MISALGDNELISEPTMFCINRNYESNEKMGSHFEIIDNGKKSLEQDERYNFYY